MLPWVENCDHKASVARILSPDSGWFYRETKTDGSQTIQQAKQHLNAWESLANSSTTTGRESISYGETETYHLADKNLARQLRLTRAGSNQLGSNRFIPEDLGEIELVLREQISWGEDKTGQLFTVVTYSVLKVCDEILKPQRSVSYWFDSQVGNADRPFALPGWRSLASKKLRGCYKDFVHRVSPAAAHNPVGQLWRQVCANYQSGIANFTDPIMGPSIRFAPKPRGENGGPQR